MHYTETKIKQMEQEIAKLREEKRQLELYAEVKKGAKEAYSVMQAFMDAGFSETQAFQLLKLALEANKK